MAYSKRRVLYGLNLAKKTKRPNMILCEGNLDVVTLHQAGFDNAVACMGTALTQEQIRLLSRFTRELVLCYDNDGAGQMATDRALELLQNSEFTVKVLRLPQRLVDGHYVKQDADDFIKYQGRDAFEQLLSGSANGIEFTMSEIASKYDLKDDKGRIAYAGEIAETLCKLNDPVEREVYTTRAAEAASLPAEAMRMEVQRAAKRVQAKARKAQERQEMNPISALQPADRSIRYQNVRSALAEEGVIRLLMQDESLFPPEMPVRPEEFSSPLLGRIYGELWQRRGHASMAALAAVLSPEEMNHLTALLQKPEPQPTRRRRWRITYASFGKNTPSAPAARIRWRRRWRRIKIKRLRRKANMTEEKYTAEQLEQMADQLLQEAAPAQEKPAKGGLDEKTIASCRRPRC